MYTYANTHIGKTLFMPMSVPPRRIVYRDPETGQHHIFFNNNFELPAKTIDDIYAKRLMFLIGIIKTAQSFGKTRAVNFAARRFSLFE